MLTPEFNLAFGWIWLSAGVLSGAVIGLCFHEDRWLGGYDSWPRRLLRLGHIAFFGTGLLNITFALTARALDLNTSTVQFPALGLLIGALAMPAVCFLSAWRKPLRHLFFIPVLSLAVGVFWTAALTISHVLSSSPTNGA